MKTGKKIERYILSKTFLGLLSSWLIILVIVGFNFIALLAVMFKLPSTPLSIAYRGSYLFISLFIIFIYIAQKRRFTLSGGNYLFTLFWIFYIIRLIYDLSIIQVPLYGGLGASYFYLYAIGGCFIPAFAVACTGKYIDINLLIKRLFYALLFVNLMLFLYVITNSGGQSVFLKRAVFSGANEDENTLGPLMISLNGAFLFVMGVVNVFFGQKFNISNRFASIAGIVLGLGAVFLGASRGPFIFSFLVLLYIMYYNHKHSQKNTSYLLKNVFYGFVLMFLLFVVIIPSINWDEINMIERLTETFGNNKKEIREDYLIVGWNDFFNNPIFGKQFLISFHGQGGYVHNVYLEVLHATGIIGGVFFYALLFSLINKLIIAFLKHSIHIYISVLVFIALGFAFTSGAIYTNPYLWVLITLFLSLDRKKNNN